MLVDHSGSGEFRIHEGYIALWKHMISTHRIAIKYKTVVTEVEWDRDGVILYDNEGFFSKSKQKK
jgi:hypothetical protein